MAASRPPSPITPDDFELMKKTALFDHEDSQYLRMSYEVLAGQVEAVLDVWYGFVASHPHLLASFARKRDGQPDPGYLAGVRKRFGQWILDTAAANYDATWLSNQFEIGRRHHRTGKNQTDQVEAADHVPFRYLIPLIFPITHTLKPFLASKGHPPEQVDKMHQAWVKSLLLQVALWSQVYVQPGDF
ncbi:MAG: protoglobin domain-containing protein [Bryobacteraceae bacterium]|nr:protoglobin domain-containing protein [Bryobacteraceae bacterium]MDW8378401.1 protoglobin domain-containing protein [Bryobacterales bacterium]